MRSKTLIENIQLDGDPRTAEEVRIRKALRASKIKPTSPGTLVTGKLGIFEAPRTSCQGHLWLTGKPIKSPMWQSGYKQAARCVVCNDTIAAIDSSWWVSLPSKKRIQLTMRLIKEESIRLHKVYDKLKGYL